MQVTETVNEGLLRELSIKVPSGDLTSKMDERLEGMKGRVKINGFRQGKVPMTHLRKVYGKQVMAEIVNDLINTKSGEVLKERKEKAAQQPQVSMTEDEEEANLVLEGKADFEFTLSYEVMPKFDVPDLGKIKVERPVAEVSDAEINDQITVFAENAKDYEEKSGKAETDDRITMDFVGKIDGEAFDGGSDSDSVLVLGSNRFIPGFEDQLIGVKAGENKSVKVTFPEEYGAEHLAGKDAIFEVDVKKVEKPLPVKIDDELAKRLGVESEQKLREVVKDQLSQQNEGFTRAKVKRQVLDQLDGATKMELPKKMVEQEFNNIWGQMTSELERAGSSFEDEGTSEDEARAEYQKLAERRVRLGLLLAEIGDDIKVDVSEEELQQAIYQEVSRHPGQEQQVFQFFRDNPNAVASLRAPIFEDKVIDHIISKASVTDKKVSREELMTDDEEDTAKDKKPAKKSSAKKAAPKKDDGGKAADTDASIPFVDNIVLIDGIGDKTAEALVAEGYATLTSIAKLSDEELAALCEKVGAGQQWQTKEWKMQAEEMISGKPPRSKVDQELAKKLAKQ